jgi:hypothetical protein
MFRGHLRRERCRGASGFGWSDVYWSVFMASACCSAWIVWAAILIARKHISLSAYQFALVVGGETPEEKTRRRERELYEREQRNRELERELGLDP